MNSRKIFTIIAVVAILGGMLFVLTGCGNNDTDNTNTGNSINNSQNNGNGNNDNTNENGNNNTSSVDLEGRIVSGKYSIIAPKDWNIENTPTRGNAIGEGETKNIGTDSFIQITTMGTSAEEYASMMRAGSPVEVRFGNYTFKTSTTVYGTSFYVYEDNNGSALITVYQVDSATLETALASFRID